MEWQKLKLKTNTVKLNNVPPEITQSFQNHYKNIKIDNEAKCVINYVVTIDNLQESIQSSNEYSDIDDIQFWIIYPKGTSKIFKKIPKVNRDIIWHYYVEQTKIRPVALFALSANYSIMRLRFCKYVK